MRKTWPCVKDALGPATAALSVSIQQDFLKPKTITRSTISIFLPFLMLSSATTTTISRACTHRFASTRFYSLHHSFSSHSRTFLRPAASCRSLSFSSPFRSVRCSFPRWSHGVDWRSPVSVRAQINTASPVLERFERNIASMGRIEFFFYCAMLNSVSLD